MFGATVIREMQIKVTMRKHLVWLWLEWLLSERQVGPVHVAVEREKLCTLWMGMEVQTL